MAGSTDLYKRMHRPLQEGETVYKQGVYFPKNPEKIVGGKEIIYRSSWEGAFCQWCDDNPLVLHWGSEPCQIQYKDPSHVDFEEFKKNNMDPKNPLNWSDANYYPDFVIELKNENDDGVRRILIEIKPKNQTYPPILPKNSKSGSAYSKFVRDSRKYIQNRAKWEAGAAWAEEHGMEFEILTEDTLVKLGLIPPK